MRIIHAAREGALGEVLALIGANPALVHAECADGSRPLACAASQGHAQVVECLVDTGAEVRSFYSPLETSSSRQPTYWYILPPCAD
jgi:ankyrin repeat protein